MTQQPQRQSGNTILYIIIGVLIIGLAAGGYVLIMQLTRSDTESTQMTLVPDERELSGVNTIDPPRELPDFVMTASTGETQALSAFQGRLVLMYFGYTHCPDACPTAMLDFRRVKNDLGDDAEDVAFVLISVDPERDTPALLSRYLQRYDESFIGLTGEHVVLDEIIDVFGVVYERREAVGSEAGYLVDHTASKFLVDREGRLVRVYSFLTSPDVIAQDIRDLL